jgi:hypothetical protein
MQLKSGRIWKVILGLIFSSITSFATPRQTQDESIHLTPGSRAIFHFKTRLCIQNNCKEDNGTLSKKILRRDGVGWIVREEKQSLNETYREDKTLGLDGLLYLERETLGLSPEEILAQCAKLKGGKRIQVQKGKSVIEACELYQNFSGKGFQRRVYGPVPLFLLEFEHSVKENEQELYTHLSQIEH